MCVGGGGGDTFNSIEQVYSRAMAFSNRRCSVLLECVCVRGGGYAGHKALHTCTYWYAYAAMLGINGRC